jgi:hypothetical protein
MIYISFVQSVQTEDIMYKGTEYIFLKKYAVANKVRANLIFGILSASPESFFRLHSNT